MSDFNFVTDRLAIGNVASRATPGFAAVVSVLATDRPGVGVDQLAHAPALSREFLRNRHNICLHIDLADGEERKTMLSVPNAAHDFTDYLDDATSFIAAHLRRGCVLVHCAQARAVQSLLSSPICVDMPACRCRRRSALSLPVGRVPVLRRASSRR